jgi:hypothetical protein
LDDEMIAKFKGRNVFRQYIPKKHRHFGIKIFKLCDAAGYTYNICYGQGPLQKN